MPPAASIAEMNWTERQRDTGRARDAKESEGMHSPLITNTIPCTPALSVFALACVGRGLVTGRSLYGVLPNVYRFRNLKTGSHGAHWTAAPYGSCYLYIFIFALTLFKHLHATEWWKVRVGRGNAGGCLSPTIYYEVLHLKLERLWRL